MTPQSLEDPDALNAGFTDKCIPARLYTLGDITPITACNVLWGSG
jgi:hypothetical protein